MLMKESKDFLKNWQKKIVKIQNQNDFFSLSKEAFLFQYNSNKVYRHWCDLLKCDTGKINTFGDIPFLPIEFFKSYNVTCLPEQEAEDYFLSSGTGSMQRSKHLIYNKNYYIENTFDCFSQFFKTIENYAFICLLPNYLEQEHSSLICMMDAFVKRSNYKQSGFYANNLQEVANILLENKKQNIPTVLFGVTYALLDLAENYDLNLSDTIIFETGGMKGRRQELPKEEVHNILKQRFKVSNIASEYGMCELFSQAYSNGNGVFYTPRQMNVFIKEINDYKHLLTENKRGIINIIDLANIYSCCFIETQDLGIKFANKSFSILGRVEYSDIRGCNLMYQ